MSISANQFEELAIATTAAIDELLIPYSVFERPAELLRQMTAEEFFKKFLLYATKSTEQCCIELSKRVRAFSVVPEVRGTPTVELAAALRRAAFRRQDEILVSYVEDLKAIHVNLAEVSSRIGDSSVVGQYLTGAAIGRVAGGSGEMGKVVGVLGGLMAASRESAKRRGLRESQSMLESEHRSLAFNRIVEYLNGMMNIPELVLDFCGAKCFGAAVDFTQQSEAVARVLSAVSDRIRKAARLTACLPAEEVALRYAPPPQQVVSPGSATPPKPEPPAIRAITLTTSPKPEPPAIRPITVARSDLTRDNGIPLFRRFGALFVDCILLSIVRREIIAVAGGDTSGVEQASSAAAAFFMFIAAPGYCILLWHLKGTTAGGAIFGLRVVASNGSTIGWGKAAVRTIGCYISFMFAGLGFVWMFFNKQRLGWQDLIAGTKVIRTR